MPDAPWVPPFFDCGECGGTIGRWPLVNLLRQSTLDWRHVEVPPGVAPHRAVLGTPVLAVRIPGAEPEELADGDDEVVEPDECPPPEVPARPAGPGELPAGAASIAKLGRDNGWTVETWYMRGTRMSARWKALGVVSNAVVRMVRDGHRLVACWQTRPGLDPAVRWSGKDWPGPPYVESFNPWKFDEAYSLTHQADPIGSPELRKLIAAPRMVCEECGETLALHHSTPDGPVCHTAWQQFLNTLEAS